jgi:hypothetical protein
MSTYSSSTKTVETVAIYNKTLQSYRKNVRALLDILDRVNSKNVQKLPKIQSLTDECGNSLLKREDT